MRPLTVIVCGAFFLSLPCTAAALTQQLPITSPVQLTRYLHDTPAGASPLDQLSPGGRKRFLAQLKFGERGLLTVPLDDPRNELTHAQIVRLFALFGEEKFAEGMGISPAEHARREKERQVAAKARGCAVDACPESAIEQRYDDLVLYAPDHPMPEAKRSELIGRQYDRLFADLQSPNRLRSISAPDLRLLKRAAEHVMFHSPDATHVTQLQHDLAEMQRRSMARDKDYERLYRVLVASRQFDQAASLSRQHPGMDVAKLPTWRPNTTLPPNQPTALTLDDHGRTMTRQAFDLSAPLRIVVVASCHFSVNAARAIQADPQAGPLFAKHAIWLADQGDSLARVHQWNTDFPQQPIHVAWRNSEWSMLDSWRMPTFYIFRHGKLVDQWNGWGDTGMHQLRTHLRKDGLLTP